MEIKDHVFVVAGAASGMGRTTAQHLRQLGAKLVLLDIQEDALSALAKELDAIPLVCDAASHDLEKAFEKIDAHYQAYPSGLINCVGIAPAERVVSKENAPASLSLFQKVIEINLIGAFNLMRLAAAMMVHNTPNEEGERGVIVHTASIAAFEGQMGQVAYSASKSGIVGMVLPAARELAQQGIRVNAIAPGLINTPLLQNLPDKVTEMLQSQLPFPKRFGKPAEFAALAQHIIENPLINGTTLRLDGALRMN